ncbi:MAG: hypothetical protein AAFN70_17345, partial [Planctomycetota bacterium]
PTHFRSISNWVGTRLQRLAGMPIVIPIRGSVDQPKFDGDALKSLAQRVGTAAVQSASENLLQEGINRLFGR